MKPTMNNWKAFAKKIIETNGNPTTKDAENCNIPFGMYFDICFRSANNKDLIATAKELLKKIDDKENKASDTNSVIN